MTTVADRMRGFARRFQRPIRCSACHLPKTADRRLISGPAVYICESCVDEAATPGPTVDPSIRCSFCAHPTVAVVRTWPELSICADCVELAQSIFGRHQRSRLNSRDDR